MIDNSELPGWSNRMRRNRAQLGLTQAEVVSRMRMTAMTEGRELPSDLLRSYKSWESGTEPSTYYQGLLAKVFGTVTGALFELKPSPSNRVLTPGPNPAVEHTAELVGQLRSSHLDTAALDTVSEIVLSLCCQYAYADPTRLIAESTGWMRHLGGLLDRRLSLAQHREVLVQAGWLALLIGCLEQDRANRAAAEEARRSAALLGKEAGHPIISAWAAELAAWFAWDRQDPEAMIRAANAGLTVASNAAISAQLHAQTARAWALVGNRGECEASLEAGRNLLERLGLPEHPSNHFEIDPAKFDLYATFCYSDLGDTQLTEMYANEVVRTSFLPDGSVVAPMRAVLAWFSLAGVSAKRDDLDAAVAYGNQALSIKRKTLPELRKLARRLGTTLDGRVSSPEGGVLLDRLREISAADEKS